MRPLIIDSASKEKLRRIVDYAEKNPFSMDDLLDMMNNPDLAAGYYKDHVCHIPFGFRIVYSIEQQNAGDVRHLSVSVDAPKKLPSPEAVEMIMKEIGFTKTLKQCMVRTEELGKGDQAINVWEVMDGH